MRTGWNLLDAAGGHEADGRTGLGHARCGQSARRDDRIGSVEEGKSADLLICDDNPLEDLKRLADKKILRAVFLDGKLAARQPADFILFRCSPQTY